MELAAGLGRMDADRAQLRHPAAVDHDVVRQAIPDLGAGRVLAGTQGGPGRDPVRFVSLGELEQDMDAVRQGSPRRHAQDLAVVEVEMPGGEAVQLPPGDPEQVEKGEEEAVVGRMVVDLGQAALQRRLRLAPGALEPLEDALELAGEQVVAQGVVDLLVEQVRPRRLLVGRRIPGDPRREALPVRGAQGLRGGPRDRALGQGLRQEDQRRHAVREPRALVVGGAGPVVRGIEGRLGIAERQARADRTLVVARERRQRAGEVLFDEPDQEAVQRMVSRQAGVGLRQGGEEGDRQVKDQVEVGAKLGFRPARLRLEEGLGVGEGAAQGRQRHPGQGREGRDHVRCEEGLPVAVRLVVGAMVDDFAREGLGVEHEVRELPLVDPEVGRIQLRQVPVGLGRAGTDERGSGAGRGHGLSLRSGRRDRRR